MVEKLSNIKEPGIDSEGKITYDTPAFDSKFLIEKYMNYTEEDMKVNERYKKERKEQLTRVASAVKRIIAAEGGGEEEMNGELGGMDLGGGAPEEPGSEEETGGATELGI